MKTLHHEIFIAAPVEKVWNTMLEDATYRQWTSAFNPAGSWYEGDWSEGSTIRFLGPDPSKPAEVGGMLSRVAENKLHRFVSLEHVGVIHNGIEDTTSEEVQSWVGSHENYTFVEEGGGTRVVVDLEMKGGDLPEMKEMMDMFDTQWPEALLKLKELAEK
jgi:uncharacterized protein YndB with AHSA1/START domain